MTDSGLAAIYLDQALRQHGCPICRCCADHETQYLRFLILECINDGATHARLAQSLGLCRRHAQQAAQIEQGELGALLGNSIIYETLVRLVLVKMRAARALLDQRKRPSRLRQTLWHYLGIPLPRQAIDPGQPLMPRLGCRVCETATYVSRHYSQVLLKIVERESSRQLYASSDGVCLAHLRAMVQGTAPGPGLDYILNATEARLRGLSGDLEEIAHRQGASQSTENEEVAIQRAIAFLTGSAFADETVAPPEGGPTEAKLAPHI